MPEFLAETYAPRGAPGTAAPRPAEVVASAGQVGQPAVRFLGAIAVPEEETCFWLYRAPCAAAVRAAMTRARLRPRRIAPATAIRPPRPRPALPPLAGGTTQPPAASPGPPGTPSRPPHRAGLSAPGTGPP